MSRPHNLSLEWPLRVTDWESIVRLFEKWGENIPPGTHPTEMRLPQQTRAFREIIESDYICHLLKNSDYGPSNILGTAELGCMVRIWDKTARLMNLTGFRICISDSHFESSTNPKNESLDDSILDLSVYSTIWRLYRKGVWGK